MSAALARHETLIAETVASHGGQLIKSRGAWGEKTRYGHAASVLTLLQR